ncbi:MAG: FKBP-type peptidyl-prolyl cis-trans isomerase [Planctomycetota bacterium]
MKFCCLFSAFASILAAGCIAETGLTEIEPSVAAGEPGATEAGSALSSSGKSESEMTQLEQFQQLEFTETESGLKYHILTPGEGTKPTAADSVEVHYDGLFPDGKKFDSSRDRGETISFPLGGVIGGWTEGMQLVAPGGRILLICPPDLAYGQRGAPGAIPPNATLYFDVELFAVN